MAGTEQPLLQRANNADLETLRILMQEFYEYEKRPFSAEQVPALADLLRNPTLGWAAVIRDGGAAAGYIVLTYGYSLEFHGRHLLVDELYLRPAYRGRGWGAWVLGEVEKIARHEGLHALHLEVARWNAQARRFYDKAGFQAHDADFMSKRL
jgi:GNAT superfamily N-acetyltransferase